MNSIGNSPVYQNGIQLSEREEKILTESAWSQSKIIAKILKWMWQNQDPRKGLTFQEMRVTLEGIFPDRRINQDSVKRAMSTMTGTKNASKKYQDKEGRWPLIKIDQKRINPEVELKSEIHVYAWNPRYNQPLTHREMIEKYKGQAQMDFHPELKQQGVK
jgi:hypothetical protein